MPYVCQYLKYGSNSERVPGYEEDLILSNMPNAPVPKKLVDPNTNKIWSLVFSYHSGLFYTHNEPVPGQDGAVIKSWYSSNGIGDPHLRIRPFIVGGPSEGFVQPNDFLTYSEPSTTDYSINTATISGESVTATVHMEIEELKRIEVSTRATSHSIIIGTTTTQVTFDHIFVIFGNYSPVGNELTIPKNESCLALAVFHEETSSGFQEINTYEWPKIQQWEWPIIVNEIVHNILEGGEAEIFEYLSPKTIMKLDHESLRSAVRSLDQRVEALGRIRSVVSGLASKKASAAKKQDTSKKQGASKKTTTSKKS